MMDETVKLARARRLARVLGTISIVCMLTLIYTVLEKIESEKQAEELSLELERCKNQ
jgi:hypothetical protein